MNDTQGFATTQAIAKKYSLHSIADMVKNASQLRLIVATEYLGRADGLPGVQKVYGKFTPKELVKLQDVGSVRYAALLQGRAMWPRHSPPILRLPPTIWWCSAIPRAMLRRTTWLRWCVHDALKAYPKLAAVLNAIAPKTDQRRDHQPQQRGGDPASGCQTVAGTS